MIADPNIGFRIVTRDAMIYRNKLTR